MIDLIIPYYNNPEGLARTLDSINHDVFYVTVVDDNSTIYPYYNPNADQILRYNKNRGPGYARQWGITKTYKPFIMFIDAGDIFLSKEVQRQLLEIVEDDLYETDVFSFPYYHKDNLTKDTDNRMHGKIYKREFLYKKGITFCAESSYMNEDIGFNRTCRLLTDINFFDIPVIKQIDEENSLTNRDGGAALYQKQTRALSLASIHTVETCRENNINADIEISQIAIALYYWFIRCAAERPEFIQEAWSGAKIFYDYFRDEIKPNLLYVGTKFITKCIQYKDKINFPINILRFIHDIQFNEIIPNYYLTKM